MPTLPAVVGGVVAAGIAARILLATLNGAVGRLRWKLVAQPGDWAIVTGATYGIGRGYALALARRGYNVLLMARSTPVLEELAETIRSTAQVEARAVAFDFSQDTAAYEELANQIAELPIAVLINNVGGVAGVGPEAFLQSSLERAEAVLNLNSRPAYLMTRIVAAGMANRGRGSIINVSSLAGGLGLPMGAGYGGAKAFVENFTRSVSQELAPAGIRIEVSRAGVVSTPGSRQPVSVMSPNSEQWAEASLRNFGSGLLSVPYVPHRLMDRMLNRWLPKGIALRILYRMGLWMERTWKAGPATRTS